jgi:hypothetical protein
MRGTQQLPVIAAMAVAMALVPGSALADAPIEHEHYDDVVDVLLPTPDDEAPDFCGLVDVPFHGEFSGNFAVQVRGNSAFPYFADHFHFLSVYTNPTTGKSMTIEGNGTSKDLRIADNGDGTITITAISTGSQKSYGPTGELLFQDSGRVRETFLVDTQGTVDPEDDVFLEQLSSDPAGHFETIGRDFCEDFLAFTG